MQSAGSGCVLTVNHVVPASQKSLLLMQLGLSGCMPYRVQWSYKVKILVPCSF